MAKKFEGKAPKLVPGKKKRTLPVLEKKCEGCSNNFTTKVKNANKCKPCIKAAKEKFKIDETERIHVLCIPKKRRSR